MTMCHFYRDYRVKIYVVHRGFNFDVLCDRWGLTAAGYILDCDNEPEAFEQIKLRIDALFPRHIPVGSMPARAGSGSPPVKAAQWEIGARMRGGRGAATRARLQGHAGDETRPPRAPFRCDSVPAASPR